MDLPDLNVWFALLVPEHPFHAQARGYWRGAEEPALCRVTALGLVRLLTNPKAMDGKPLSLGEAWNVYRALREMSGVPLLEEPSGLEDVLGEWVASGFPPRLWTDAYLAAFAVAGGYRLVTFDGDFHRFHAASSPPGLVGPPGLPGEGLTLVPSLPLGSLRDRGPPGPWPRGGLCGGGRLARGSQGA